jgi:hypothetical protein
MRLLFLCLALIVAQLSLAQAPDFGGDAERKAMAKMTFMVGTWEGTGWFDTGGRKVEFHGKETIIPKLNGTVFQVEGLHTMERGGQQVPVHSAFGVIRYIPTKSEYAMWAHLENGLQNEYKMIVRENGYSWSQVHPTLGDVTYTAEFTADTWVEYGETTKDGTKVRFYEMRLKKQPEKK